MLNIWCEDQVSRRTGVGCAWLKSYIIIMTMKTECKLYATINAIGFGWTIGSAVSLNESFARLSMAKCIVHGLWE